MEHIFLSILNRGIASAWMIILVILFRFLIKIEPKNFRYILWGLVGIRLACPFLPESRLSLVPSAEIIPESVIYSSVPEINSGITKVDEAINPIISAAMPDGAEEYSPSLPSIMGVAAIIWLVGMVCMLAYFFIGNLRIKKRVRTAMHLRDNIWLCDQVKSPFVFGVIHPKIYLPSGLERSQFDCMIAHENVHLKHHDHWWKIIGFLILAVYWFHPLVWISYYLFCKDIEFACDECVVRNMGVEEKKEYSRILLSFSVKGRTVFNGPLAFGENDVKKRIGAILSGKQPGLSTLLCSVGLCIVMAICFFTNPVSHVLDMNDISDMNIGTGIPQIVYGDAHILVMNGSFGLIQYDLDQQKIENRIPYTELEDLGIEYLNARASQNGEIIYMSNYDDSDFRYQYHLKSKKISKYSLDEMPEFYYVAKLNSDDPDENYLKGDEKIDLGDSFYYLRVKNDGSMSGLQIVWKYKDGNVDIMDVF